MREPCAGAIWGQRRAAGLESPLLRGKKDDAESQKSDRGERKSTGRLPGGGNLTGWKRVTGFGASVGRVVRVLAENSEEMSERQAGIRGVWSWMLGWVLELLDEEGASGQATYSEILSKWLGLFLYL